MDMDAAIHRESGSIVHGRNSSPQSNPALVLVDV
jgi:hypothetical protein